MSLRITQNHLAYHSGQHDFRLVAYLDGREAGHLDYSDYNGTPHVSMIESTIKGQGVATQLVVDLQSRYPSIMIDFGLVTDDGKKLLDALKWEEVPNEGYSTARTRLKAVEKKLQDYAALALKLSACDQNERDEIMEKIADWNEVHDECDELAKLLRTEPEFFRYVAFEQTEKAFIAK